MEASRGDTHAPTRRIVVVGTIGGLLAGLMMAMIEMIYGWLAAGRSFWDAPMAIWAWVFGSTTSATRRTTSRRSSSGSAYT